MFNIIVSKKKSRLVGFRITDSEFNKIKRICNHLNMDVSQYIRMKVFQPDNIEYLEFKERVKNLLFEVEKK